MSRWMMRSWPSGCRQQHPNDGGSALHSRRATEREGGLPSLEGHRAPSSPGTMRQCSTRHRPAWPALFSMVSFSGWSLFLLFQEGLVSFFVRWFHFFLVLPSCRRRGWYQAADCVKIGVGLDTL